MVAPDDLRLPPTLRLKTADTDPIPPTRGEGRGNLCYLASLATEVLTSANSIAEDIDPNPSAVRVLTTLDTLYDGVAAKLPISRAPIMTYYHGPQARQFVSSGFSFWAFAQADAQQVVDFVLQDIWGLHRHATGVPSRP